MAWSVPDFSTLSRRQKSLKASIPCRGSQGPLHLLIDSTGIKVDGEGEWSASKHDGPKRRVWGKLPIGIDEQTLEIRAAGFTSNEVGDAPMLPELLNPIPADQEIGSVTADGAYVTRKCRDAAERGAHAVIPPPQERKAVETGHRRSDGQKRIPARITPPWPDDPAPMERLSPPEPRRTRMQPASSC